MPLLRTMRKQRRPAERAHRGDRPGSRSESDELYDAGHEGAVRGASATATPMAFIVGAEIYDHLEKVVDRFEDVANRISGILIEHL